MGRLSKKKALHIGGILLEFLVITGIVVVITVPFFQKPVIVKIPEISEWKAFDTVKITRSSAGKGEYLIEGNGGQCLYQIQSPKIRLGLLPKTCEFTLPVTVHQGTVGVGVLNGKMTQWIIPPLSIRDRYVFTPIFTSSVYIVIANANPEPTGNSPSRFTIFQP